MFTAISSVLLLNNSVNSVDSRSSTKLIIVSNVSLTSNRFANSVTCSLSTVIDFSISSILFADIEASTICMTFGSNSSKFHYSE